MATLENLETLKVSELRGALKELGVRGYSKLNKSALQDKLRTELRKKGKGKSPRGRSPSSRGGSPRRRSPSPSSRGVSPRRKERKEQLQKMKVAELKGLMDEEAQRLAKVKAKAAGKSRPTKPLIIQAILVSESKGKGKEKRKAVDVESGEDDSDIERLNLKGWTVIGDLDVVLPFLRGFELNKLRKRIVDKEEDGLVRFELDPNCEETCGAFVLCVYLKSGNYPLGFAEMVNIIVGRELNDSLGEPRGDFYVRENLLIGDLESVHRAALSSDDFPSEVVNSKNMIVVPFADEPEKMKKMFLVLPFGGTDTEPYDGFNVVSES